MRRLQLPAVLHNWVSYAGAAIAALALTAIAFLFLLISLRGGEAPYAGIITFVVLPAVMLVGLALVPIGMLIEWRQARRTGRHSIPRFPVIDLNLPHHRNAVVLFAGGSVLLLFLSAFGSFEAYEATESVAFCGTTCHVPMEPEYTTYQNSPHARVRCVECHVGPGADWYVKSKLNGLYQVYSVLFDKFPRPIPGTIAKLRPAQDTCEQCHWPDKFFGSQQLRRVHYLADETNTRWEISLLVKTGGTQSIGEQGQGIHWHMNIDNRIEYVATDQDRQQIPWIRATNRATGETTVYTKGTPIPEAQLATLNVRVMDCMDCHNRPAHILRSPKESISRALQLGDIDPSLPSIVETGVELLKAPYSSVPEAMTAIQDGILRHYQEEYPEIAETRRADLEQAIAALQEIYRKNFFPEMKARWDVYPNNIGHLEFPGCFRCHDGEHRSADGKVVTADCNSCHVIIGQGRPDEMAFSLQPEGLPFEHPGDVGDAIEGMLCPDCHAPE
ncbi:MAG TPA: NapC/NirT family cytochrome c [Candidatus Limnocylindria bacterium]|nr:NapC/NirT family cytochrome c [Candidatus Limnocylindria bacterium]